MRIYKEIRKHPTEKGWIQIVGDVIDEPDVDGECYSDINIDAFRWRAAEHGIDENDLGAIFKILFAEILDAVNYRDNDVEVANPWKLDAEAFEQARADFLAYVSGVQQEKMQEQGITPEVDREDLAAVLPDLIPDGTISGRAMEEKKLVLAQVKQVEEPIDLLAIQQGMILFHEGATDYAESAIVGGWYEVQSRIESGIAQQDLIDDHEIDMIRLEAELRSKDGQANEEQSGDGGSGSGEHQLGDEGSA